MKVSVEVPNRLSGEMSLAPVTVVMGPPGSGKTTLLKLIYFALYAESRYMVPDELMMYLRGLGGSLRLSFFLRPTVEERGREPDLKLDCASEKKPPCDVKGMVRMNPFYLPMEYEVLAKNRACGFSYESYRSFLEAWARFTAGFGRKAPPCAEDYLRVVVGDPLEGKMELRLRGSEVYEALPGGEVPLAASSTTVAKLGVLEQLFLSGLLDDYDLFLLDSPEAALHPVGRARLSLLIHSLANCGKTVVVATHDVMFLDMLSCVGCVNKIFRADVKPAQTALYLLGGGTIKQLDVLASYIKGYTEYIYALYGYKVDEVAEGVAVVRRGE
ncbi:MAG: hypothetical protein QXP31_07855 [Pyrobaculum sp.]